VERDLIKASERLSELNIRIHEDGYSIVVQWFRLMFKEGDWLIRRHAHSTFEFHFIARGDCLVETEGSSFLAKEGSFFLTAPGVYHAQKPGESPELVECSLNCEIRKPAVPLGSESGEIGWLDSVFRDAPCIPVQDSFGALGLFDSALREADRRLPGFATNIRHLAIMLLVSAARSLKAPARPEHAEEEDAKEYDDPRMDRMERFVEDNIHVEVGPADLAALLNLSGRQVARIVRHCKGYSTKKFITRTKLKTAKHLLATTDLVLKEIAERLGFSNEYYFSNVFKKHEGYPPGLFRKSMRQPR
jgi:AraC-like DNA-binding protein